VERKRWGKSTPPNFDARAHVLKNKALTREVSIREQNKNKQKQKDRNKVGCLP